jgi:uncharacterized protein YaaQ
MKLLIIVIQDADARRLRDAFSSNRIPFTKLASTGGFLRQGACTFLSGIADNQVEQVKRIIEQNSRKRTAPVPTSASVAMAGMANTFLDQSASKVEVGGATIFALSVEEYIKL